MAPHSRLLGALVHFATAVAVASTAGAQERPIPRDTVARSCTSPRPHTVLVHVTSDAPHTALARFDDLGPGGKGSFYDVKRVCTAPCSADVPIDDDSYRLLGPGLTPSDTIVFPSGASNVDVDAHPGSWRPYVLGVALTAMGSAYVPTGGGFLVARAATDSSPKTDVLVPIGVAFLVAGVAALAIGIPLWRGNRTHVDVRPHVDASEVRSGVHFGAGGLVF